MTVWGYPILQLPSGSLPQAVTWCSHFLMAKVPQLVNHDHHPITILSKDGSLAEAWG